MTVDMPVPDENGNCLVELRFPDGTIAGRGHFRLGFVAPRYFLDPAGGDRLFTIEKWNTAASEPSIFVMGRQGVFVPDSPTAVKGSGVP